MNRTNKNILIFILHDEVTEAAPLDVNICKSLVLRLKDRLSVCVRVLLWRPRQALGGS